MNTIQKKAILFSLILGIEFLAAIIFPDYHHYLIALIVLSTILVWALNFSVYNRENLFFKLRFLPIPLLFNFGAVSYVAVFGQTYLQFMIALMVVVANYYLWVALKRVHNLVDKAAILQRNIVISASFLSVFFSLSFIYRLYVSTSVSEDFRLPQFAVVVLSGLLFYLVANFLAWENGLDMRKLKAYNLVCALLGAEMAWIGSIWIVNYPVFVETQKANLSVSPLPAVILTVIFYFLWGITSHKADKSLNKRVMSEYIFIAIIFLTILVFTAKWLPTK